MALGFTSHLSVFRTFLQSTTRTQYVLISISLFLIYILPFFLHPLLSSQIPVSKTLSPEKNFPREESQRTSERHVCEYISDHFAWSIDAGSWTTSETCGNDRNNFPSFCSFRPTHRGRKYFTVVVKNDRTANANCGGNHREETIYIRFRISNSASIQRVDIARVKCLITVESVLFPIFLPLFPFLFFFFCRSNKKDVINEIDSTNAESAD